MLAEQPERQPAGMFVCLAAENRHDNIPRFLTADGFKMDAITRTGAEPAAQLSADPSQSQAGESGPGRLVGTRSPVPQVRR